MIIFIAGFQNALKYTKDPIFIDIHVQFRDEERNEKTTVNIIGTPKAYRQYTIAKNIQDCMITFETHNMTMTMTMTMNKFYCHAVHINTTQQTYI